MVPLITLILRTSVASAFSKIFKSEISVGNSPNNLFKIKDILLDIIYTYKKNNKNQLIKLSQLEANYWTRIERDDTRDNHTAQLGERIANLYLEGFILNKAGIGYNLTRKGKEELLEEKMEKVEKNQ